MRLNNNGFAIMSILYTILVLFLLLLSSLLAILSTRINKLVTLTTDISDEIKYNEKIDENIVTIDSDYFITNYRGKYEFTINGDESKKCYSYLPNNALIKINDNKIQFKVFPNISQCMIDINNTSDLIDLEIFNCDNTNVNNINFINVKTSQEENYGQNVDTSENLGYKTLVKLGLTDILNEGEPTFTSPAITDEGIYAIEDDLGTSYYFRGASTRNYIKFGKYKTDLVTGHNTTWYSGGESFTQRYYFLSMAECENFRVGSENKKLSGCKYLINAGSDMYWRIIRINGDGTIRMIYDGIDAYENGVGTIDRVYPFPKSGALGYHYDGGYDTAKYAKLQIDNTLGSSNLKLAVDDWYEKKFLWN